MLKKVSLLVVLALILLVGAVIAAQPAEDGSVAWQSAERVDDQVTPKIYDVFLCAAICAWGGCTIPGTLLECTCVGGQVCCLYFRCLQNPLWMFWAPCYCGTEMDCLGIPCTPGDPIPFTIPGDLSLQ